MLDTFDSGLLDSIFIHLKLEDLCRVSQSCMRLRGHMENTQSLNSLTLEYADRQKLRRLLFKLNRMALPSHFVHIFLSDIFLRKLLCKRNKLQTLDHRRSSKELKQHNPYFHRSLPLALHPTWALPPPVSIPEDVPLPHDLSLCDIWHLLLIHRKSLRNVSLDTYDSPPLSWSCTPSRTCPRDLIGSKCPNHQPPALYLWCPECEPAKYQHKFCWQLAGETVLKSMLEALGEEGEEFLQGWQDEKTLAFPKLERLRIRGWASAYLLCLLRLCNVSQFPALKELYIGGVVLVAPSMTNDKNHIPRPRLERTMVGKGVKKLFGKDQKNETLGEVISLHSCPLSTSHENPMLSQWWLGLFNGSLWDENSFPNVERVSFRVGNFDDSCRWLIPLFENCLSKCPKLKVIELDHSIVQTMRPDDALVRLFNISGNVNDTNQAPLFPALQIVKIRSVESILELIRIQHLLSNYVGHPVCVQPRKLYLRLASCNIRAEARVLNMWQELQRDFLLQSSLEPHSEENPESLSENLGEHEIFKEKETDLFADNHASMLCLDFDLHVPNVMGIREEQVPIYYARVLTPQDPLYLGNKFAKLSLLYFSPSNPIHRQIWDSLSFSKDPETEIPSYIYDREARREAEIDRQTNPILRYVQTQNNIRPPAPNTILAAQLTGGGGEASNNILPIEATDLATLPTLPTSNDLEEEQPQNLRGIRNTMDQNDEDDNETISTLESSIGSRQTIFHPNFRRIKIQLEFPNIWQELTLAKETIATEINALREILMESLGKHYIQTQLVSNPYTTKKVLKIETNNVTDKTPEIRIATCPRLTYGGGANWLWWEKLISGSHRNAPRLSQVQEQSQEPSST